MIAAVFTVIITKENGIRTPMTLGNNLSRNPRLLSLTTQADRQSAGSRQNELPSCRPVIVVAHHNHLVHQHNH
jgi:hypothetical protein